MKLPPRTLTTEREQFQEYCQNLIYVPVPPQHGLWTMITLAQDNENRLAWKQGALMTWHIFLALPPLTGASSIHRHRRNSTTNKRCSGQSFWHNNEAIPEDLMQSSSSLFV